MKKKYKAVKFWAKIPHGIWLREATSVSVDSKDNVYVFIKYWGDILCFPPADSLGSVRPTAGPVSTHPHEYTTRI